MTQNIEALPGNPNTQLTPIAELRRTVDELRRVSGLPELQNDPRSPGTGAGGSLARFFQLDALSPSAVPGRENPVTEEFRRKQLQEFQKDVSSRARTANASWENQLVASILEFYPYRERLPGNLPSRAEIEFGANLHITRLMTNMHATNEFISTLDAYTKFLVEHSNAESLRNPAIERQLMEDARMLQVFLPYWGRALQLHFSELNRNLRGGGDDQIKQAREQLQQARDRMCLEIQVAYLESNGQQANAQVQQLRKQLSSGVAVTAVNMQTAQKLLPASTPENVRNGVPPNYPPAGLPLNVSNLTSERVLETLTPVEGHLRTIVFTHSDVLEQPRHNPSLAERLIATVHPNNPDQVRRQLAQLGLTEAPTREIRGRRVHAAYLNLLIRYRRQESDRILQRNGGTGALLPQDIETIFRGHHDVSQLILREHLNGLQTTTTNMFAGTLGVAQSLQQNPAARLNAFTQPELQNPAMVQWLNHLASEVNNPSVNEPLREQRQKSAEAVRNYVVYLSEEGFTIRQSYQLMDRAYLSPLMLRLTDAIESGYKTLEGWSAIAANWAVWGPILAYQFPQLRNLPFNTSPQTRREILEKSIKEIEEQRTRVQSLQSILETTQKQLEGHQKRLDPLLKRIMAIQNQQLINPAVVKDAQDVVRQIAGIEQEMGKMLMNSWNAVEVNMKQHAETMQILDSAQDAWGAAARNAAIAIGTTIANALYVFHRSRNLPLPIISRPLMTAAGILAGPIPSALDLSNQIVRRLVRGRPMTLQEATKQLAGIRTVSSATNIQERFGNAIRELGDLEWRAQSLPAADRPGFLRLASERRAQLMREMLSTVDGVPANLLNLEVTATQWSRVQSALRAMRNTPDVPEIASIIDNLVSGAKPENMQTLLMRLHEINCRNPVALRGGFVRVLEAADVPQAARTALLDTGAVGARPLAESVAAAGNSNEFWRKLTMRPNQSTTELLEAAVKMNLIDDLPVGLRASIGQSQGARDILNGAINLAREGGDATAEVNRALRAARVARNWMILGNFASMGGDAFGAFMAYADYQENGRRAESASSNPALQEIYRQAQWRNVVEGGISLTCFAWSTGTIAIAATQVGIMAALASPVAVAAFPLTLATVGGSAAARHLESMAADWSSMPRDWLNRGVSSGEIMQRLVEARPGTTTDFQTVVVGGAWSTDTRYRRVEAANAGMSDALLGAYFRQNAPQVPGEDQTAMRRRLQEYSADAMLYMSNAGGTPSAENLRGALAYADIIKDARNGTAETITWQNGGQQYTLNLSTIEDLPWSSPSGLNRRMAVQGYLTHRLGERARAARELLGGSSEGMRSSPERAREMTRNLLLMEIAPDLHRLDGLIRAAHPETGSIVTDGMSRTFRYNTFNRIRDAVRNEAEILSSGTPVTTENLQAALDRIRAILPRPINAQNQFYSPNDDRPGSLAEYQAMVRSGEINNALDPGWIANHIDTLAQMRQEQFVSVMNSLALGRTIEDMRAFASLRGNIREQDGGYVIIPVNLNVRIVGSDVQWSRGNDQWVSASSALPYGSQGPATLQQREVNALMQRLLR